MSSPPTYSAVVILCTSLLSGCALFGIGGNGKTLHPDGLAPSLDHLQSMIRDCRRDPAEECRDNTLQTGMAHYDNAFMDLKEHLLGVGDESRAADSSFLVGDLVIAAASSRESQPSKLADMSALGAFLAGLKSVFFGDGDVDDRPRNATVLVNVMESERLAIARDIKQNIRPTDRTSLDEYPLDTALADLRRYGVAGTVEGATARNAQLVSSALALQAQTQQQTQ
ncbi:MAG: hypothetical protein OXG82_15150 [Gammaproteobacteria bacterium]|nr:hypothetical protein [Gammaproteobacteria bacterium]